MSMGDVKAIVDAVFDSEVLESTLPVLVDFWAPWCGPCRAIAPIVEDLAGQYGGRIEFAKVNVDENPSIPTRYGIRSIPTLILFRKGKVEEQIIGVAPKQRLVAAIEKVLALP
jgi:thioredoxin 1